MKHLIITTIAAVLLVGCGGGQQLTPAPETQTEKPVDKAQAPPKPEIETVTKSPKQVPPIVKAPEISIHTAALKGDMKAVKQHLVAGTDVNQKGSGIIFSYQGTPLHQAAGNGHVEIAEILIANGANVNAKDRLEQTPLDRAYLKSDKAFVELLRKHNGKSGAEDSINVAVMVMNM